jgi:protein-tyrosine phosphatase
MHDVHCHLLPGLDDGPEAMEDAVAMARVAAGDGIAVVLATPHGEAVAAAGGTSDLLRRVAATQAAITQAGIKLDLRAGTEHQLSIGLANELAAGKGATLNGTRYVLVEMDFTHYQPFTEEALFQLRLQGYQPVLAHPERQEVLQRQFVKVRKLLEMGVLMQVTAGSVAGDFGPAAKHAAEALLKEGAVHFLATDAHRPREWRPPVLSNGLATARRLVGESNVARMVIDNPRALLEGKGVVRQVTRGAQPFWMRWKAP